MFLFAIRRYADNFKMFSIVSSNNKGIAIFDIIVFIAQA